MSEPLGLEGRSFENASNSGPAASLDFIAATPRAAARTSSSVFSGL
jgi:hypothetical protein